MRLIWNVTNLGGVTRRALDRGDDSAAHLHVVAPAQMPVRGEGDVVDASPLPVWDQLAWVVLGLAVFWVEILNIDILKHIFPQYIYMVYKYFTIV